MCSYQIVFVSCQSDEFSKRYRQKGVHGKSPDLDQNLPVLAREKFEWYFQNTTKILISHAKVMLQLQAKYRSKGNFLLYMTNAMKSIVHMTETC
jgi:hypothetical protein